MQRFYQGSKPLNLVLEVYKRSGTFLMEENMVKKRPDVHLIKETLLLQITVNLSTCQAVCQH